MDFYVDIGVAVLLRILKEQGPRNKYRRAFLKVFRSIAIAYSADPEFMDQLPSSEGKQEQDKP